MNLDSKARFDRSTSHFKTSRGSWNATNKECLEDTSIGLATTKAYTDCAENNMRTYCNDFDLDELLTDPGVSFKPANG